MILHSRIGLAPLRQRALRNHDLKPERRPLDRLAGREDRAVRQLVHVCPGDVPEELGVGRALGAQQDRRQLVGKLGPSLRGERSGRIEHVEQRHAPLPDI